MRYLEPRIFIGSSSEGRPYAEALLEILRDEGVYARGWWEEDGMFPMGRSFLQSLEGILIDFNAALLLATPDDLALGRGKKAWKANGNVLLEYGMFLGAHGALRTALATVDLKNALVLPSDLGGIRHIKLTSCSSLIGKQRRKFKLANRSDIRYWLDTLKQEQSLQSHFFRFPSPDAALAYLVDQLPRAKNSITHAAFSPPIPEWDSKSGPYQQVISEILTANRIYYRYLAGIGPHRLDGIQKIFSKFKVKVDPKERRYTPSVLFQVGCYTGINFHILDRTVMHLYVPGTQGQPGESFLVHRSDIIRAYLTHYESLWVDSIVVTDAHKAKNLRALYDTAVDNLKSQLGTV